MFKPFKVLGGGSIASPPCFIASFFAVHQFRPIESSRCVSHRSPRVKRMGRFATYTWPRKGRVVVTTFRFMGMKHHLRVDVMVMLDDITLLGGSSHLVSGL